jgi:alpha-galactosidase/6-phospho-beta-glucosidase family protein
MSQLSGSFWKNIVVLGDLKNGEANSRFEINLMDGSNNSLKQLNKYLDRMYSSMPKNDFQEFEAMDTTLNLPSEIHK